jgi:transcriptional regulator with XRE-family HTH domain
LATTLGSKRHRILIALLIERRKAAGMTQAQLAKRLGKSQSFISRLESGQRRVYVVELLKLAEALGFGAGKVVGALGKARREQRSIRARSNVRKTPNA